MSRKYWLISFLIFAAATFLISPTLFAQEADSGDVMVLSLDDAIKLALENNEKVKIAKEDIIKAKAVVLENASSAWPQITAIAGYKYNIEQPTTVLDMSALGPLFQAMQLPPPENSEIPMVYRHEWNFTLSVSQNIYTFGRITNAIKLAKTYEKASKTNQVLTNDDLIFEVRQAYYNLILAKEALKIAKENYNVNLAHYNNVKQKYDAGIKSEFDLLQSRADLAAAKPTVIIAETAVIMSRKILASILSLSMDQSLEASDTFDKFFPTRPLNELVEIAGANRREIHLIDLQTNMYRTTSNLYISNYLPILAADMNYTYNGISATEEDAFWPEDNDENWRTFWSVGVSFTWPIFDGLNSYAKIRQYRSEERISRLQKAALIKGIELELTQIMQEYASLKLQLDARSETILVAEKAFELAFIRYDNGLGTALEKNDARVLLFHAKLGYIQTLHGLNLNRAKLQRALGKDEF